MKLQVKYRTQFAKYGVDTPRRMAMWMATMEHESGLEPIAENLHYSAEGLLKTFPKYFKTMALALVYARKPREIANFVYGHRMGNQKNGVDDEDGWMHRGRGLIQITGYDNYVALAKDTGLDCVNNPDILLTEGGAVISALWFWKSNNLNKFADKKDLVGCTKVVNGGLNGIKHRTELYIKWCAIFKC